MRMNASAPFFAWLDHDHLVAADAETAVRDGARRCRIERKRLIPRVEYDEIVAKAVHFQERGHLRPI